jgi:hypothetical protein
VSRFEYVKDLGDADSQYGTDIPYANSPDEHDSDQADYPGKASPVGYFMAADKLATAVFTAVILFALVFFSRFGLCWGYDNGGN